MVGSNYRQRGLDTASVRSRQYQVAEQENRTVPSTSSPAPADTICRMEDQSLVVLSALLDSLMLQQGFTGADYQHAKELFQPSLASCEKPPGYAAKLDVVDTYDLLE